MVMATLLTAILAGLGLGAIWALLYGMGLDRPAWLSLAAAAGMALSMHFSNPKARWSNAALAGLGTCVAAFYAETLQLLWRIAAQLGLPLIDVIRNSGILASSGLAWRLLPTSHLAMYATAAAAAFILSLALRRHD